LASFNIVHETRLKVDDFLQNYQLCINILHEDKVADEQEDFKVITSSNIDNNNVKSLKRKATDNPEDVCNTDKRMKLLENDND
jgi:hypothetical protein